MSRESRRREQGPSRREQSAARREQSASRREQLPRREVITAPRREVRRPHRTVAEDIDQETRVGRVFLQALIRTQLRLGLATVALVVVPLAALPLLFGLVPGVGALQVGPLPLWWLLLGFLVYPAILAVGWWYVRQAERNEARFTELVEGR